ncbi:MAG: PDZ domain-containing protein, partial [Gemmatimonadota bacterium]|nr:PDZ domain-containing protein [Gemmatimonadota bacterium]
VDAAAAKIAGLTDIHGAYVGGFTTDNGPSPAEKAGLQPADVIVTVDGQYVRDVASLQRLIRNYEPGQTVKLGVMRYGKQLTIPVKLGEPPATPNTAVAENASTTGDASSGAKAESTLGISVAPLTEDVVKSDSIPSDYAHGLLVTQVSPNGPSYPDPSAVSSGLLPRSDIIVRSLYPKRMDIKSLQDLSAAVKGVKSGDYLQLFVYNVRTAQTRPVNIQIP